jgi:hypothetical protein
MTKALMLLAMDGSILVALLGVVVASYYLEIGPVQNQQREIRQSYIEDNVQRQDAPWNIEELAVGVANKLRCRSP